MSSETYWLVELPVGQDIEKAKNALINGEIIGVYPSRKCRKLIIKVREVEP